MSLFRVNGIDVIPHFLNRHEISKTLDAIAGFPNNTRNIAQKVNVLAELANSHQVQEVANRFLSKRSRLVRTILFDKNPSNNWLVPWHQDRTIAIYLDKITRKAELSKWTGWTIKEGIMHVQPDLAILNRMLTLRIHLDDTHEDNACLRVIHGSHHNGILNYDEVISQTTQHSVTIYPVNAGDLVIMHPLIIHASYKSITPTHRRVLHFEFCDAELPKGVMWA